MAILSHKIALSFAIAVLISIGGSEEQLFQNEFEKVLDFECKKETQAVSSIQSIYGGVYKDRRFAVECRDVPYAWGQRQCHHPVNWENKYDNLLAFHCPPNRYSVGMESKHIDGPEDRRWRFDCCGFEDIVLHACELTGWTNDLDEKQDFRVPSGKVITGVISFHDNSYQDRRYKYNICQVGSSFSRAIRRFIWV